MFIFLYMCIRKIINVPNTSKIHITMKNFVGSINRVDFSPIPANYALPSSLLLFHFPRILRKTCTSRLGREKGRASGNRLTIRSDSVPVDSRATTRRISAECFHWLHHLYSRAHAHGDAQFPTSRKNSPRYCTRLYVASSRATEKRGSKGKWLCARGIAGQRIALGFSIWRLTKIVGS